jgi:hypothetical protein
MQPHALTNDISVMKMRSDSAMGRPGASYSAIRSDMLPPIGSVNVAA